MFPPRSTFATVFHLGFILLAGAGCVSTRELPAPPAAKVRPAGGAGAWYPADPAALKAQVQGFLERAKPAAVAGRLVALVVPHAGYVYSGQTAAYAYGLLRGRKIDRVVVLGPSHYTRFRGFAVPDDAAWETPLGKVKLDLRAIAKLRKSALAAEPSQIAAQEHSLEAQIPFLQTVLGEFELVPLLIGSQTTEAEFRAIADLLRPLAGETTLLVASSDFTHYGPRFNYVPFTADVQAQLRDLDMAAVDRIAAVDASGFRRHVEKTGQTVCGRDPVTILLDALPPAAHATMLAYETSGALTGDWTNSVSYVAMAFTLDDAAKVTVAAETSGALSAKDQAVLLALARASIKSHLRGDDSLKRLLADLAPGAALTEARGVFVTIQRKRPEDILKLGRLRGCIGDIFGTEALYRNVIDRAVDAASEDPRFPPMKAEELDQVELEISVLDHPREVADPGQVVAGKHGVLIAKDGHRGVFLPQVATEQGWGREELLDNLCRKAGISTPGCWREGAKIAVFEAQVFGEAEGSSKGRKK